MTEPTWEFCELHLYGTREIKGQGLLYNLDITYIGEGEQVRNLATLIGDNARIWRYNPFYIAMRMLGSSGWELVTVQHGTGQAMGGIGAIRGILEWSDAFAYFKRPVQHDRRVDEPPLQI